MNYITRRGALGALILPILTACGSGAGSSPESFGQLSLPLAAQGPSGLSYRLRDAVFDIYNESYYYGVAGMSAGGGNSAGALGVAGGFTGGSAGTGTGPGAITLYGEDDPSADSINVSLDSGYYAVTLRPGWRFEKVENGVASPVAAQLLSPSTIWTYVSPHSTTWASFQFGIGDHAMWFNGDLNINVNVYEDPNQYYGGYGGYGGAGTPGTGGAIGTSGAFGTAGAQASGGAGG